MSEATIEIDQQKPINTNMILLVAVGLAGYIWDLTFNFGAFDSVFLGHFIAVWLFSLSVLFISLTAPSVLLPGDKRIGYSLLILPSIWLLIRVIDDVSVTGQLTDLIMHGVGVLAITVSLPYLVYLFFYFTNPEIIRLRGRLVTGLLAIILVSGSLGYTLGSNNHLVMTCNNFVVSGQDTPANCVKSN